VFDAKNLWDDLQVPKKRRLLLTMKDLLPSDLKVPFYAGPAKQAFFTFSAFLCWSFSMLQRVTIFKGVALGFRCWRGPEIGVFAISAPPPPRDGVRGRS